MIFYKTSLKLFKDLLKQIIYFTYASVKGVLLQQVSPLTNIYVNKVYISFFYMDIKQVKFNEIKLMKHIK